MSEDKTTAPSSITEALERAIALHVEVLRQVEELLADEDVISLDDELPRRDSIVPLS
jgi:hypothetical protein